MAKKRTFVSFDYDYDLDIKGAFVAQARNEDSPFEIVDMSIKEAIAHNWKEKARQRIKTCDVLVVLCGEHTDCASGVSCELQIAKEENIPYFLLQGRNGKKCVKPKSANPYDTIYNWTWNNIKLLFQGYR